MDGRIFCTQCGHDPLLQADNDRRAQEKVMALQADLEQTKKLLAVANEELSDISTINCRLVDALGKIAKYPLLPENKIEHPYRLLSDIVDIALAALEVPNE